MKKLSRTDQSVLERFGLPYKWAGFEPDGSLFWNGVRRQAANRLVKRGLLVRTEHPLSAGYLITDAGREWLRDATQPTGRGGE